LSTKEHYQLSSINFGQITFVNIGLLHKMVLLKRGPIDISQMLLMFSLFQLNLFL